MSFLNNTDIVVGLGFLVFVGILIYFKVPAMLATRLDARAAHIKQELEEARALREEAQSLLASFERKQKEVVEQAGEIVAAAKAEAERAAEVAKEDIRRTVARRLQTASDQIDAAEKAAIRQIRDRAVSVAVAAAADVIGKDLKAADRATLIDQSIAEVGAKLH